MRLRLPGAALAALTLLCAPVAASAADNYTVKDSVGATQTIGAKDLAGVKYGQHVCVAVVSGVLVSCNVDSSGNQGVNLQNGASSGLALETGGNLASAKTDLDTIAARTPAFGQTTKSASSPVTLPIDPDFRPSSGTITAADSATSTVAGQSSVALVTGSPTASSFQTWALNGHSSASLTVTGTFSATLNIEISADGGTTYVPASGRVRGAAVTATQITAPGVFQVDVTGATNVRVRASAYVSGTPTVVLAASASPGLTQVVNPGRLVDSGGGDVSDTINHAVRVSGAIGGLTGFGQSATVPRPANTTPYASGQAVCASTSSNCTPLQVTVAGATGATGTIGRVWLLKSGAGTTNASFNVSLFSSAPTVTSVHDASSYVGPFAADVPNWIGDWSCTTPTPTSDGTAQQKYECIPTSPTSLNQYQALGGQTYVDAMIWTAGAYTPASGEVFTVYANSYRDK